MKKNIFFSLFVTAFLFLLPSLSAAGPDVWRGNTVDPNFLPDDLKSIKIESRFFDSGSWPVGTIQNLTGHVVVLRENVSRAYFAAAGDIVYQNDTFYTLKDSRCRIRFSTEDIVTMGENGKIVVEEVNEDHIQKKKKSVFNMMRGKAMFYVTRLFKYRNVSATVKTPTAVTGVRGTKFGVEVRKVGEKVADLSDNSFIYLAQNEPGNFETIVYAFEGTVDVTSTADRSTQTVGAGENLVLDNTGAGSVEPTDPNTANQFVGATEGGGAGAGGATQGGTEEGTGDTSGGDETTGETNESSATADSASEDVAQVLTSQTIEMQVVSGASVGYFSALLTRFDGTNTYLADLYTNSSRSDLSGDSVTGNSIVNPAGFITAEGTGSDESTPYLTRINTVAGGPYDSGDLGSSREMNNPDNTAGWPTEDMLGENSYMKWGFWAMSRWVPLTPPSYAITDRAYHLDGLVTPDNAVAGMAGAYTYAGSAWGTYFDGGGGTDMVGTFACGIDMTVRTVTDFDMSVSGGSCSAVINNAFGSFIGASGEFNVTGGTWELSNPSPLSAVSRSCTGSLFGPNAEHMGGAWAMDAGVGNNAAVGIFIGDKGGAPTTPSLPPVIP